MTSRHDTLLTLIVPAPLEENVVDSLLATPALAAGFTTSAASGHGADLALESANEKVRGRGRRIRFEIAVSSTALAPLLQHLSEALRDANVYYWTTALRDCGRLA